MTTTTFTAELRSPHDFIDHPDNRPGGLKQDHIDALAKAMREKGFDEDYFIKYCIVDDTWPAEYSALKGKPVLLGGHHRKYAAIRANILLIPAREKKMTYAETLEFLDRDNDQSPLHWFEKGILNEKRRKLSGMSTIEYGEKVLGYANKNEAVAGGNYYSRSIAPVVEALLKVQIKTADIAEFGAGLVFEIATKAPEQDWRRLFTEIRLGHLPANAAKLRGLLKEQYSPAIVSSTIPNATSYLYIASSPNTPLIKCGMTTGNDPVKYVAQKARDTWSLDFTCDFFIEIPTVHIQAADAAMRDKLSKGWGAFREFYTARPAQAKRVLLEIAAQFADPDDDTTD
jgi:hypothetical protein